MIFTPKPWSDKIPNLLDIFVYVIDIFVYVIDMHYFPYLFKGELFAVKVKSNFKKPTGQDKGNNACLKVYNSCL